MKRPLSLNRIQEIQRTSLITAIKDEVQVVRWRGRRIVIKTNSPFVVRILNEESTDQFSLKEKEQFPVELLLKILRLSQKK